MGQPVEGDANVVYKLSEPGMSELVFIAAIIAFGLFWSSNMKARETALAAVSAYCGKLDLQLLDDYVALNGFYPTLNNRGRIQVWRSYTFEFSSTGLERYNGKIVLFDGRVQSIDLEPYREPEQTEPADFY